MGFNNGFERKQVMRKRTPVLLIGIDAADATFIERLCGEGKLPVLARLKEQGCFGLLETDAKRFSGGVWPTFYTGKEVPWHGIYHSKLWRQENMRCEVASAGWLGEKPFWEFLDGNNYKIGIIDVPMLLEAPKSLNGLHLSGWGTHDLIRKGSWPPELWKQISRKFGPPVISTEYFGPQTAKTLIRLRDNMLKGTDQMVDISLYLLGQKVWDLFVVVLGAAHRGGHYLWDLSQVEKTGLSTETKRVLEGTLTDVYQACDRAIYRLIENAPQGSRVLVFAVHGMGSNPGWGDRCPEIITRIKQVDEGASPKTGILYKIRESLPWDLISTVTTRLPRNILDRLVSLWSARMFDWASTRHFPLPMDYAGYLRINLKGRELQGIVYPGPEYAALVEKLAGAFLSFSDIESGKPIVERVFRMEDLAPQDAPYRHLLPDLVITWSDVTAVQSQGIRSEKYGEIRWDKNGMLPSGRSGNHRDSGWFVAVGEGISPGICERGYRVIDLAPTVFAWLGAEPAGDFQGKPIPALCCANPDIP
jgi:predicted AlkP superfamily phosphohydrolase/phosphomutase